jgi:hypothetical protein
VALVAVLALATLGATTSLAGAQSGSGRQGLPGAAIASCRAVLDGTVPADSRLAQLKARSCALACGRVAVEGARVGKDPRNQAAYLQARQTCFEACAVILEVANSGRSSRPLELRRDPIGIAANACIVAFNSGATALPVTDNSGRSWR